ncbi:MarR family transcriptional regulator [Streptomyces sp. ISL-112]|uniref:MarR family winged helix-turn-helix transcriptional regulator n=1 Tax=unclassified Streptomyces TaxID=2593676 RepID=UPI001BEB4991|nr:MULTISPECIES: MarR family transcriptional regulator [unclassified Streptomyces]MBT2429551.1 MarR family transcriptional regulator [Streptomyces sp. ISL-112]MBT2462818.1 MarR family transcriptional regulator [Streptomyces sp. ISL-63]
MGNKLEVPDADTAQVSEGLVRLWENVERHMAPVIPPAQLRVLQVVNRAGVLTTTKIAEMTGALPSSVSRLCGRLQTAGLLLKEENGSNRRETLIRLSPQGRELLRAVEGQRLDALQQVLELLGLPGSEAFLEGLTAFNQSRAWE